MAYPPYQRCKPTADAWLGEVPAHWTVTSLRRYLMVKSGDMISALEMEDDGYPVFGGNGFRGRYSHWNTEPNTLIIGRYGALCGNARVTTERIWATEHAFRAVPILPYSPRFFCYLVEAIDLNKFSARSAQPGLNSELVRANACAVPPLDEQDVIADFLDRETARIDVLIDKKRRLLELLEEKRLAVITQAVTKGPDPNVPMKDSGIDWLGRIPAHWEAKRLRFVMETIEQGWSPLCNNYPAEDDEWGVLKVGCVNGTTFDQSENKALPSDLAPREHYEISSGDILMSRANTKELLGSAAIVQEVRPKLLLCDKLYRLVVSAHIDRQFAVLALRSHIARFQCERAATGTSGSMQNIGQDTIKDVVVALPPLEEQRAIVAHLNPDGARTDRMMDANRRFIDVLQEYRSALITNAVTGKIDVRGEVEKEAAA